jgi:hypothetical protein
MALNVAAFFIVHLTYGKIFVTSSSKKYRLSLLFIMLSFLMPIFISLKLDGTSQAFSCISRIHVGN